MNDQAGVGAKPPILDAKHHASPPVFRPENLLREARRQRRLPALPVPEICILDPDGDIVRALRADGRGQPFAGWACYHTEMLTFELAGVPVGIVGCAVGAPFAVLVAEQMFASGCRLLLSVTSAGRIALDLPDSACFVLIDRALRDEGTSYHYLPADDAFAHADPALADFAATPSLPQACPCCEGQSGQRTRRSEKPRRRSPGLRHKVSSPSRWRRPRCMRSHRRATPSSLLRPRDEPHGADRG